MSDDLHENEEQAVEGRGAFVFWFVFAAALGFLAIVLPPYMQNVEVPPFNFFEAVTYAIEKQSYWSLLLLFGIGVLIGWHSPYYWALKCCATMASFPLIAIVEFEFINPTSHDLWPFEFAIYAAETIPALFGGAITVKFSPRRDVPPNPDA